MVVAGTVALSGVLAACGDDTADVPPAAAPFTGCEVVSSSEQAAAANVDVQLTDYAVVPASSSVAAGDVQFRVRNVGARPHELVVVRGGPAAALPRDKDGSMAEEQLADLALTGEIEEFPPGEQCEGVFDLEPGSYALLCNLVERVNGKTVVHFREGMSTAFTVTG